MDNEDKIQHCRKNKWIEAWFAMEALGTKKEIVETSLKDHISKMQRYPDIFIYETDYKETENVDKDKLSLPEEMKEKIDEAWSQVVEIRLFVKKFSSLINMIYLFGPSAIEILGPDSKELKIDEIQDIANTLAGLMHQFASA